MSWFIFQNWSSGPKFQHHGQRKWIMQETNCLWSRQIGQYKSGGGLCHRSSKVYSSLCMLRYFILYGLLNNTCGSKIIHTMDWRGHDLIWGIFPVSAWMIWGKQLINWVRIASLWGQRTILHIKKASKHIISSLIKTFQNYTIIQPFKGETSCSYIQFKFQHALC